MRTPINIDEEASWGRSRALSSSPPPLPRWGRQSVVVDEVPTLVLTGHLVSLRRAGDHLVIGLCEGDGEADRGHLVVLRGLHHVDLLLAQNLVVTFQLEGEGQVSPLAGLLVLDRNLGVLGGRVQVLGGWAPLNGEHEGAGGQAVGWRGWDPLVVDQVAALVVTGQVITRGLPVQLLVTAGTHAHGEAGCGELVVFGGLVQVYLGLVQG